MSKSQCYVELTPLNKPLKAMKGLFLFDSWNNGNHFRLGILFNKTIERFDLNQ
jgi:hypothetical protein